MSVVCKHTTNIILVRVAFYLLLFIVYPKREYWKGFFFSILAFSTVTFKIFLGENKAMKRTPKSHNATLTETMFGVCLHTTDIISF